jgi:hypothetical protein
MSFWLRVSGFKGNRKTGTQRLKPHFPGRVTARLKPCPSQKKQYHRCL